MSCENERRWRPALAGGPVQRAATSVVRRPSSGREIREQPCELREERYMPAPHRQGFWGSGNHMCNAPELAVTAKFVTPDHMMYCM